MPARYRLIKPGTHSQEPVVQMQSPGGPNPNLPVESGSSPFHPIIPPISSMPFIDRSGRLTPYAFQFLQQLYAAIALLMRQGGGAVMVSDIAPENPQQGWLWFDPVSGNLFVWYDDGTSAQWVNV